MSTRPRLRRVFSPPAIAAALEIRRAVFVQEQGGPPEEEPDARDADARHYLAEADGRPVGAARLLAEEEGTGRIGRVCLLPEVRGRGWGRALMSFVIADAESLGLRELVLDAQEYAIPFYRSLGFEPEGEVFMDAGIPHRRMRRKR